MLADGKCRLIVNINDLRRKNPKRALSLLNNAFQEQQVFQKALNEYVFDVSAEHEKNKKEFFIAFEGSFGNKHVTPRTLTSNFIGNLICVEGIVTKCKQIISALKNILNLLDLFISGSLVHPKVVRSVHHCPITKKIVERKYTDLTSFEAVPSVAVYPIKVGCFKPFKLC